MKRWKHGHSSHRSKSPTYRTWSGMMSRCYNPNATGYERYGGIGIIVCKRWHSFAKFLSDMGTRPADKSLDRKNPNGNYCKRNCRWATRAEQNRNKRFGRCTMQIANRVRTLGVIRISQREIARRVGLHESTVSLILNGKQWTP